MMFCFLSFGEEGTGWFGKGREGMGTVSDRTDRIGACNGNELTRRHTDTDS